ncbi:hypothetical protein PR048_027349 [Dryococelus australis]|uniref:Uncharacterized protein n=1 Tax=Dryococelus australis TaxID=614101 RepID=A0ABQ9GF75_9NEOP|nr:hypothetical protein PR048_027349 [Dryococelus australis]
MCLGRDTCKCRVHVGEGVVTVCCSCAMSPTPPLPVTEDTPPDMLAGSMDLQVVLPSGKSVKMSVERSTPMMDLLVQVTTANKIAPGSHVLQALGERGVLPYKPSTPIGTLDTWTIQVIPKSRLGSASSKKAPLKPSNQQPFEQTFRLQVSTPLVLAPDLGGSFNTEVSRADEGEMRREWSNVGMQELGKRGDPRENPPTSGIVRDDSNLRKSGVTRSGIEPGSP